MGRESECIDTLLSIEVEGGVLRGRTTGIDGDGLSGRIVDQPECVAADGRHVRIHHRDGRGGSDHRFDGVATFAQNVHCGFGGGGVGGDGDTVLE